MEIELIVVGEPRPWTVYTKRGEPGIGFENMKAWQAMIGIAAIEVMAGRPPIKGAVRMDVMFCRSIPKKGPPKVPSRGKDLVKEIKLADWCDEHLIKRPDRDNYLKAFSDALNRIIYVMTARS